MKMYLFGPIVAASALLFFALPAPASAAKDIADSICNGTNFDWNELPMGGGCGNPSYTQTTPAAVVAADIAVLIAGLFLIMTSAMTAWALVVIKDRTMLRKRAATRLVLYSAAGLAAAILVDWLLRLRLQP